MGIFWIFLALSTLMIMSWAWTIEGPSETNVWGASARSNHEAKLLENRLIQAMFNVDPNGPTKWIRKWTAPK